MKKNRRIKPGAALAMAALLLLPCLNLMPAHAAKEVDLDKDCSLTVSVEVGAAEENADFLEDFHRMQIPVSVYRVADVDVTGQKFTGVGEFKDMTFESIGTDSGTKAAAWQEKAKEAAEILGRNPQAEVAGETTAGLEADGTVTGLKAGMYLVAPEGVYNPEYTVRYTFTPYLTALPSSEYTLNGAGSDEWAYHTEIGLKAQAEPQYGSLSVGKTLENFNTSLGNATFVFHVTGTDPATGEVRYDEVAGLTFSAAGDQTVMLEGIPAGLSVTVTEEYSGASYENSGAASQTATIRSDAAVEFGGGSGAAVTFQNRYGGGNRGGSGVTNHFESDGGGGWNWEQDPPASGQGQ